MTHIKMRFPVRCLMFTPGLLFSAATDNLPADEADTPPEPPTMHVYKVGMGSSARLVEGPSAAAAAMFYGVNLISTNNPFAVVCYEEDGQPWQGDSFWISFNPSGDHVTMVLQRLTREDVAACRVVPE